MGWGDEIMATALARRAQQHDKRKVQFLDRSGMARWDAIWRGNPRIAHPDEFGNFNKILNCPGCRPYIAGKTAERWTWLDYACEPGEIYLSDEEIAFAASYRPQVVIEPTLKELASPNKQWQAWAHFAELCHEAGIGVTQLGPAGKQPIPYADLIHTPDFRSACAVLANAKAYVGHEGGMHHAAAALGVPAVVIFGGYISPAQTGYADHKNLFTGGTPCGNRFPCAHCAEAMQAITPQMVLEALLEILNAR